MSKRFEKTHHKEGTDTNKYMKRCQDIIDYQKMQIKTTMKYHCPLKDQ